MSNYFVSALRDEAAELCAGLRASQVMLACALDNPENGPATAETVGDFALLVKHGVRRLEEIANIALDLLEGPVREAEAPAAKRPKASAA